MNTSATNSAKRMEGRRAFVTGGGSGIGRATAIRLGEDTHNHITPMPDGGQLPRQQIETPISRVGRP